jgi:hypothetical protein
MKQNNVTAFLLATAALISSVAAGDLDFKLEWYHDGQCTVFAGEYDYNSGGIFGSGDTDEGCKNIALGWNIGSANVIGYSIQADCHLFTGPNCSGQELAYMHEGTFGHPGHSDCLQLAAPIQSFICQEG